MAKNIIATQSPPAFFPRGSTPYLTAEVLAEMLKLVLTYQDITPST
jgi:hypothetical protein